MRLVPIENAVMDGRKIKCASCGRDVTRRTMPTPCRRGVQSMTWCPGCTRAIWFKWVMEE